MYMNSIFKTMQCYLYLMFAIYLWVLWGGIRSQAASRRDRESTWTRLTSLQEGPLNSWHWHR